jgi:hypothetical protein
MKRLPLLENLENIPEGVEKFIEYKGSKYERFKGYVLNDDKWKELKKDLLKEEDTKGVTDWKISCQKSVGWSKYSCLMYSPSLDRLRGMNMMEFYGRGVVD